MKTGYFTRFKYLEDIKREKYFLEMTGDLKYIIKVVSTGDYKGWYYLYIA